MHSETEEGGKVEAGEEGGEEGEVGALKAGLGSVQDCMTTPSGIRESFLLALSCSRALASDGVSSNSGRADIPEKNL